MLGFPTDQNAPWPRRRIGPVYAEGGMVAAAHPLMTSAGLDVLARGGNAVDAAVAAAVTGSVVMPDMCGLGGDLFAIVSDPRRPGPPTAYLGSGISPRGATIEQMRAASDDGVRMPFRGPLAVGVPGMVDGYYRLLANHGSRSFADLAQPAIGYAEQGHPIIAGLAESIATCRDLLASFPASAAVFLPGSKVPAAGDRLRQPDLARTLRAIVDGGPDAFYRGGIASRIAAFLQANGGAMAASDFADYATVVEPAIATTYRRHTIYQTGLPTQGLILLQALNIAELATPDGDGVGGAAWTHRLVEAKKLAYADRMAYAADPAFHPSQVDRLIGKAWAKERAAQIDPQRAMLETPPGGMHDGDTTYLCVVDGDGMMVSLIQSVSAAFGCGMVAGDTGVVLNNRVGRGFELENGHVNVFAPGKKTMHTLNCYLIADEAGRPVLVGGTPGGDGQPQWNLQTISAMIDGGFDVQAAIELPRWTSMPGTDPHGRPAPYTLNVEAQADATAIDGLRARGHDVRIVAAWDGGGSAQAIARDPATGILAGGTDPRVEGMVAGR